MTTAVLLLCLLARCSTLKKLSYMLSYTRTRTAASGTKLNESAENTDPNGKFYITIRGPPVTALLNSFVKGGDSNPPVFCFS